MIKIDAAELGEVVFSAWQSSLVTDSVLTYQDLYDSEKLLYQTIGVKVSNYVIDQISRLEEELPAVEIDTSAIVKQVLGEDKNDDPTYLQDIDGATVAQLERKLEYCKTMQAELRGLCNALNGVIVARRRSLPLTVEVLKELMASRLEFIPPDYLETIAPVYLKKSAEEVRSEIAGLEYLYANHPDTTSIFYELNAAYFVLNLLIVYGLNH